MVTISNLRNALTTPADSFKRLKGLAWNNKPIIRSTYFAETVVMIGDCEYLLSMPLSAVAMHRVEQFCKLKRHLKSSIVPPLRIMRDEMSYTTATGEERYCDILLEPLPNALLYSDAVANAAYDRVEAESLLVAINTLEEELRLIDVSLNNLRKENLRIDNEGLLRPIRWYYATNRAGGDKDAIEQLRNEISGLQESLEIHDTQQNYSASTKPSGHISARSMLEGLIAVEDESGWGFVDCNNCVVVEPMFNWVSDFREGRAEVELNGAMGLIDKMGRFVIDPIFDILDYDHVSGHSRAKQGNEWHIFDYSGRLIEVVQAEEVLQYQS